MARIFLVLLLFLCCCKKKDAGSSVPPPAPAFSYTVVYDSVVTVYNDNQYNFSFLINVLSGDIGASKLTFAVSGMPAGTAVYPATQTIGHELGGIFTFKAAGAIPGTYRVNLDITGNNVAEHRTLVLKVRPAPDYAPLLAGTYATCSDYCNPASVFTYTTTCATVADTPYLLTMSNLRGMGTGQVVRAWIDTAITIPRQQVNGSTIWGTGVYGKDSRPGHSADYVLAINDTIVTGTYTTTCTVNIRK